MQSAIFLPNKLFSLQWFLSEHLSFKQITLYFVGQHQMMEAFVLVTSIGTGDSKDAPPKQVCDVLRSVLLQKARAEDKLNVLFS